MEPIPAELDAIGRQVIDAAFKVHSTLGPGLLESIYERCLKRELEKRGFRVQRQVMVPIEYDGEIIDDGLRIDLLVEGQIIVELKAVEKDNPLFKAQVITYLKLTKLRLGYLINFNVELIKEGMKRIVR
ncbi:MAG: GxxExxY protein [Phycisphaerae bacterium]|nr:GxxExxY protein [Phycisphaerae bacterium]MDW8263406.1 GxxExxY protein [Phycisphaerales bacterium]